MTMRENQHKKLIAKLKTAATKKLKGGALKKFLVFFDQYTKYTPYDDLNALGQDNILSMMLSGWEFIHHHKPGAINIRVFNPETDKNKQPTPYTVIEITNDDRPFLVDSVTMELARLGHNIHALIHPTYRAKRNAKGTIEDIYPIIDMDNPGKPESFIQVYIETVSMPDQVRSLRDNLMNILEDVRASVRDWQSMRAEALAVIQSLDATKIHASRAEREETQEFLTWMTDNKFTFLGYQQYKYVGKGKTVKVLPMSSSRLGIATVDHQKIFPDTNDTKTMPAHIDTFVNKSALLNISKTHARATIHRATQMDCVIIKKFDKDGKAIGEHRFVGLFTSVAYRTSANEIPILKHKIKRVFAKANFLSSSHNGKALVHILETYPRDELFQISQEDLFRISLGVLHLRERQRVAVFVREDEHSRFISCFIYIPRDRFNTAVREKFQNYLAGLFNADVASSATEITDASQIRTHVMFNLRNGMPSYNIEKIEHYITEISRRWDEDLSIALKEIHGPKKGQWLTSLYRDAFPPSYQEHNSIGLAIQDIDKIETCLNAQTVTLTLYRTQEADLKHFSLKIYSHIALFHLSTILPTLENLGLKVLSELPYEISLSDGRKVWMQDFDVRTKNNTDVNLDEIRALFKALLLYALNGSLEDDSLNTLVLTGKIGGRRISILRALGLYLKQTTAIPNQDFYRQTIIEQSDIAIALIQLFEAKFDPKLSAHRADNIRKIRTAIDAALDKITSLEQDRILRRLYNAIQSALRTNYYQLDAAGKSKSFISIKFRSAELLDLPKPTPFAEIFVYSPRFEAIHLRGGKVARGGLRWSDRPDDFRTEVLGLMRAQIVKNAVIIPVGSKGGFFVKSLAKITNPAEQRIEVVECYKNFIRGMLDITDNLKGKDVIPPKDVVRYDEDDPYLVVAADKGTANFSDIANSISADYKFWLGDAFASGGSQGYSHKDLAITARGGWESVKRHFREMGVDCQNQDFTAVGVGDMAGDVFGNGALLSKHMRLMAAFNHIHIFIDPTPDAAKSFTERQRLFDKPGSTWMDYNAKLISKGGGVFSRKEKKITITTEMKLALDIKEDSLAPNDLIRAILKAPVDLIWLGGIGTYVKSVDEDHLDVGDRNNDALRINGKELRAKIVGEGANLGFTQQGRIEYALAGGRLNTDFIDNSAGVDCSDHEVNIKILLDAVVESGKLSSTNRNKLLQSMKDEVCDLVLRDNYLQTQILSLEERASLNTTDAYNRQINHLTRKGVFDPKFENIPDNDELTARRPKGVGFTRPEISLLLSYTKIDLYSQILDSTLPDDPLMLSNILRYFPDQLSKKYLNDIKNHRLKREIIATYITNSIVNRVSIPFVNEMREKTGRSAIDIVRCYSVARDVFDIREIWKQLEALDLKLPTQTQYALMESVVRFTERTVHWLLRGLKEQIDTEKVVLKLRALVKEVTGVLKHLLLPQEAQNLINRQQELARKGVPADLALKLSILPYLESVLDLSTLVSAKDKNLRDVSKLFFAVGRRFHLQHLKHFVRALVAKGDWHQQAIDIAAEELVHTQARLTALILKHTKGSDRIDQWINKNAAAVERLDALVKQLNTTPGAGVSAITVINQHLFTMAEGHMVIA